MPGCLWKDAECGSQCVALISFVVRHPIISICSNNNFKKLIHKSRAFQLVPWWERPFNPKFKRGPTLYPDDMLKLPVLLKFKQNIWALSFYWGSCGKVVLPVAMDICQQHGSWESLRENLKQGPYMNFEAKKVYNPCCCTRKLSGTLSLALVETASQCCTSWACMTFVQHRYLYWNRI